MGIGVFGEVDFYGGCTTGLFLLHCGVLERKQTNITDEKTMELGSDDMY